MFLKISALTGLSFVGSMLPVLRMPQTPAVSQAELNIRANGLIYLVQHGKLQVKEAEDKLRGLEATARELADGDLYEDYLLDVIDNFIFKTTGFHTPRHTRLCSPKRKIFSPQ